MPFTALDAESGILDATLPDLGCRRVWEEFYKQRDPRPAIVCPECGWGLHAKLSPQRVRFFCHDPGQPNSCTLAHESMEHHLLKLELAGAIRDAGWYAQLEVAALDRSWRADVMATSPDGLRRMAWEAQLSSITEDDIRARTDRYTAEDISVCWVSPNRKPPTWIGAVPAVSVHPPEGVQPLVVRDGLVGFDPETGRWAPREERLGQFVRWILDGKVQVETLRSQPWLGRTEGPRNLWWTSTRSIRAVDTFVRERKEKERAQLAAWERNRQEAAEEARARQEEQERERLRARDEAEKANPALRYQREADEYEKQQRQKREAQWAREVKKRAERRAQLAADAAAEAEQRQQQLDEQARVGAEWWGRLSRAQIDGFFAAVTAWAWEQDGVRIGISYPPKVEPSFAYGIPVFRSSPLGLYGVVRPCPALLAAADCEPWPRLFFLSGEEYEDGTKLHPRATAHFLDE
ncbi:competence protein CoiA family protein (plasmid) [Streptomyces sp. NBC_00868]|uniref:competence protein CoiA family protein n=1 Tax=Streptomyces sp. NBC_00868 TaxID=2903683 RepID=UPI002F915845|nr:competence protein CoiA family protein [Streptomyces sp. NBC_00868]